jgi:DNA modification methylase|nr:MAG TPA: adenine specific DNA methyltransferase [Caudoviricetes sp.]
MQIEKIKIADLLEYKNNAKEHPQWQIDQIVESIEKFGFNDPIAIDENNTIIEGHGRLYALQEMGADEVECIRLSHLSENKKKAYILAHNKLTMNTDFDSDLLAQELGEIEGIDMSSFGFLLDPIIEVVEDDFDDESVIEQPEPIAKLGDVYQLGEHFLMCGDSTDFIAVKKLCGDALMDLLVTDPPYNVAYEGKTEDALTIENDNMDDAKFREFLKAAFACADGVMRPGAAFYIWHADSEGFNFRGACRDIGWTVRQCLIWNKNQMVLGRQDYQWKHEPCLYGWKDGAAHYFVDDRNLLTVLEEESELKKMSKAELINYILEFQESTATTVINEVKPSRNGLHPTMKPLRLIERLVRNSSKKGENVLDLFNGIGSTLMVCEQLGRRYFGMELDPRYVDATIERWEEFTGKKAVKISSNNQDN